ncbi:MAG TPA: hypothetical protein VN914_05595 [Polyangia bacterium]|nr:hypothetical protein [Polyangia bacterium]
MELLVVGWTILSIAIGFLGRMRGDGFFLAFLCSLALSPLVGFALTMLKLPRNDRPADREAPLRARA